jgi:Tol biopolymer transport system component
VEEHSWIAGQGARAEKEMTGLVLIDVKQDRGVPVFLAPKNDSAFLSPSWSPDGKKLAVVHAALKGGELEPEELLIVSAVAGGAGTASPVDRGLCGDPQWSPDGKTLAYTKGPPGHRNIYLYDTDTGTIKKLTSAGDNFSPRFSPKQKASQ